MRPLPRSLTLLLVLACLSLAPDAHAVGVSLRWNDCSGFAKNKDFACDTNSGNQQLTCTFRLGASVSQVSGNEIVIDLASAGSTLPQWWTFRNAGTCRMTSLVGSLSSSGACIDWAGGRAAGGIGAYNIGQRGPNTARVVIATAVTADNLRTLASGTEYFSFALMIDNQKTVGTGSCAGCTTPVCLVLTSINLNRMFPLPGVILSGPDNGIDSNWATWQGGAGVTVGGITGCPHATPTAKRAWSAVKALYY